MTDIRSWNYTQLPKGIYAAHVRKHGSWDGWFLFRAFPNSGSNCLEYVSQDENDVIAKAESFVRGERDPAIYSAS
jgi:hypothetical protein